MADALQHHVREQFSLGRVQQGPLFLGEVNSYILEGHSFLKQHGRRFRQGCACPPLGRTAQAGNSPVEVAAEWVQSGRSRC